MLNKPIIYCNDAFCELTGYSRSDIIQKPCSCEFLYGAETNEKSIKQIRHALQGSDEKEVEITLYKNNGLFKTDDFHFIIDRFTVVGMKFRCSVLIAPVKNESFDIILFILEFTESSDSTRQRRIRKIFFLVDIFFVIKAFDILAKIHEYSISPTSMFN